MTEPNSFWDYTQPTAGPVRIISSTCHPLGFINELWSEIRILCCQQFSWLLTACAMLIYSLFVSCLIPCTTLGLNSNPCHHSQYLQGEPRTNPGALPQSQNRNWECHLGKKVAFSGSQSLRGTHADPSYLPRYNQWWNARILGWWANGFGLG